MPKLKCISCHIAVLSEENFSQFKCPGCEKTAIVRCKTCRKKSNIYRCKECGFEGP